MQSNNVTLGKFILSTLMAGITVYLKAMAIPIIVLLCFMVLDYITGITASWLLKTLSSRTGIIGIIKKIFYLVMIAVGMGADWVIQSGLGKIGITCDCGYAVSMVITIWLIINELISILENVAKVNDNTIPSFLSKILLRLKNSVENKISE